MAPTTGLKHSDGAPVFFLVRTLGRMQMDELFAATQKNNKFNKYQKRRTGAC